MREYKNEGEKTMRKKNGGIKRGSTDLMEKFLFESFLDVDWMDVKMGSKVGFTPVYEEIRFSSRRFGLRWNLYWRNRKKKEKMNEKKKEIGERITEREEINVKVSARIFAIDSV